MGAPQYEQAGADVAGSGTLNTIPRWTGATTLGDSGLIDNGTAIYTTSRVLAVNTSTTLGTGLIRFQVGSASSLANYQGAQAGFMLPTGSGSWVEFCENSASGTTFRISKDASTGVVLNANGKNLGLNASAYTTAVASSQMVLLTNGNVGIGTASPTAGRSLTTAADIDVYGVRVGRGAGASTANLAVGGAGALANNTTGVGNTAIGAAALNATSSGARNTAVGEGAGYRVSTNSDTTHIGRFAGVYNTGGTNTSVGAFALNGVDGSSTGSGNVAVGYLAATAVTTGGSNTAVGSSAAQALTTGVRNTMLGESAGVSATTASDLTYVGRACAYYQTGGQNTALGQAALLGSAGASTATNNVALGYQAGFAITTGGSNVCVGHNAGNTLTTGTSNIVIGTGATTAAATDSRKFVLGSATNYVATDGGATTYYATAGASLGYIQVRLNGADVKIQVFAP